MSRMWAGFPSAADDYLEVGMDLNEHLIKHPAATFFMKVKGDSMKEAGIFSGDILIVDRAVNVKNHHIVVAIVNGAFTVRRFVKEGRQIRLLSGNPQDPGMMIEEGMDFEVWGVVIHGIHSF